MKRYNPWLIISTMLLQIIVLAIVSIELFTRPDLAQLKSFLTSVNIVLIILSLLVLLAIRNILINYRQQIEINLAKIHLTEVQHLMSLLQEEKYKSLHHINTIGSLLQINQRDKALDYTTRITSHFVKSPDLDPINHIGLYTTLSSRKIIAESKGILFSINIQCDLGKLPIKSWDLCSIIGNLLDNALEATLLFASPKKLLELKIVNEDNWYIISVTNTGPSIKPIQKSKLFQPGYTSKGSAARGFGLYTVRRIVDQYGGAIDVFSDTVTTFIVYLPGLGANEYGKNSINSTGA